LAAVEKQGLAVVAFHAFHFAEEDGVIPGWVLTDYVAGKFGQRAVQQGNSGGGPAITDAQEGVLFRGLFGLGEILGKRLLPFAKNTDAKAALRFKKREKSGIVITQTRIRSGSSETEVKELAVMPCTTPGSRSTAITVTPVANAPVTRRNITGSREEMAMALTFQDNTGARTGAKGG